MVSHNPEWQESFKKEAEKIKRIFGEEALDIQHVGSTAIPGISAKPIIDIALIVPSFKGVKSFRTKLEAIGYKLKEDDARGERIFFTKGPEANRTHYLHIGEAGNGYAEDMILFRDYLRGHKDAAGEYSRLKERLAKEYKDKRETYTEKKKKFIQGIIRKAGKSRRTLKYLKVI